uniref:Uncharacterized protein n=1 Tax=Arundo donax TaxID=35708 RepID=A0A0A9E6U6_ARUDO
MYQSACHVAAFGSAGNYVTVNLAQHIRTHLVISTHFTNAKKQPDHNTRLLLDLCLYGNYCYFVTIHLFYSDTLNIT